MAKRVLSVAGIGGLGVVTLILAAAQLGHAQAFPTSDRPAGYVVFAKVVVDTSDLFALGRRQDTLIQLTNTGQDPRVIECFYVDATSRCNNGNQPCRTTADCTAGGQCLPRWSQTNFTLLVTEDQPIGWQASTGTDLSELGHCRDALTFCRDDTDCVATDECVPADGDGIVPPLEPFFMGELKCFEVDGESIIGTSTTPLVANDLKGEASIYDVESGAAGSVDVRAYNAIGFQALATVLTGTCVGGSNNGTPCATDDTCIGPNASCSGGQALCLGASPGSTAPNCATAGYASCPSILVVNHFFDGAEDPVSDAVITSDLTLVPCSENLTAGPGVNTQPATTAQILVFNEFEQRFSTQIRVTCFKETQLSHIDQAPGNESSSLFNVAVEGTLTGQTRIRPVLTSDPNNGNGLLAIVEEFHGSHSAAFNVDYIGTNGAKGDIVRFSVSR